jgi:pimeloyl-ACP methyl ester carboxylesterase
VALRHQTIEANGVPLHVVEAGDEQGQPIIWMHGIWDRWLMWEPVMAQIPGHHFMVELRGHGESGHPEGAEHYRWVDYADDIGALIGALDLPRVSLVGFSIGAVIATLVAAREPERVTRAVAVDPPYHEGVHVTPQFADLREVKNMPEDEIVSLLSFMRPDRDEAEWRREASWLHMTADGAFDAMIAGTQGEQDLAHVLPRIHQPLLLLQADPKAGAALSDAMADYALARLPDARIVHFPGSSHNIAHDQPEAFIAAVREFLGLTQPPVPFP